MSATSPVRTRPPRGHAPPRPVATHHQTLHQASPPTQLIGLRLRLATAVPSPLPLPLRDHVTGWLPRTGPVPVLHSGDMGAVIGVASVLGKEPCGYSCVAVEEGAWAYRISSTAWREMAHAHPAWMLQLQRVALLQEMYNGSRIRSMSRLWLAGGWTGANFDTVTAATGSSAASFRHEPNEPAGGRVDEEEEQEDSGGLQGGLQGVSRGFRRASAALMRRLSDGDSGEGGAPGGDWARKDSFFALQAKWAEAASGWVNRRRSVSELH